MRTLNKLILIPSLLALSLLLTLMQECSLLDDGKPSLSSTAAVAQGQDVPTQLADQDALLSPLATITISGTVVTEGGIPVEDVPIGVGSSYGVQEVTTNPSGFYSVTIEIDGSVFFTVHPQLSTRLSQINIAMDNVTASFTQNFTVTTGYLLSVRPTGNGGVPITTIPSFDLQPLADPLTAFEWYFLDWQESVQRYQGVLPPDVYYVTAQQPPDGYYDTTQIVDLRTADQDVDMPLRTTYVHPLPYDPPDATKISVGPVDNYLGEATVTGAPGAALPFARVVLVNVSAGHQADTISAADGSFSARIYAPPGSAILVKHGSPGPFWAFIENGLGELAHYPGAIFHVPHTHAGHGGSLPFAATGAVQFFFDDDVATRNYVGAAWAVTGTLAPGDTYAPGAPFQVTGTLRLYSPAITATTDVGSIVVNGSVHMMMGFDQTGRPIAPVNSFMSTMLTPSGFPIQRRGLSSNGLSSPAFVSNLHYVGGHLIEGDIAADAIIPIDWPSGTYRPWLWFDFINVPTNINWLAAHVTPFGGGQVTLPPITVGSADPPRLVWHLLANNYVQGTRGTGAREDRDIFGLASQIVSQGAPYYTPPIDVRTGHPISYRLEPFLPMISYTDRRIPGEPRIPFDLPSGQLDVSIREPDGTVRDLGSEAFAQSFVRTMTTREGVELNVGTTQLDDVYSLKAATDRFRVTFDQYGHHVVTMTGTVDDIWGNTYTGGGTYDLWIAHPLDVDPGVLPGTPLAVDDAFNPTVQFYPRVPAVVTLTLTLYPDSDPTLMEVHTRTGQANVYGYFSLADPIPLTQPGEYRVDLTATYTEADGTLYMGAQTWGGIVMTPESVSPHLVAHGRRGLDSLDSVPGSAWFVSCRDLSIVPGRVSHTLNPYFNGDMLWSRMVDAAGECPEGINSGGDSLILAASVQDTVGVVQTAILTRATRMNMELAPPGNLNERTTAGELPLFISTRSARSPQFVLSKITQTIPSDVDQIAYSYRSSQRPGVRVREMVGEDAETGGYWRLDTLYDDQLGVGVEGDRSNDYKFQYVGVVYRDLDTGRNEYLGHGSGWIFIPDEDPVGSRSMPPFAGYGAWTAEGGPILTLKGEDVHIFILPTGTRPGAVLQAGDVFRFAGHIMPTLDSKVAVTVTAPGGMPHVGGGQANSIGYFYDPADDFVVDEPGLWTVDVHVWHDGQIGDGEQVLCATTPSEPCPSGDVLGSDNGRYWFYVVPPDTPLLNVSSPSPGFLSFDNNTVTPITITGSLPAGLSGTTVDYVINMAGYILEHGQATINGNTYQLVFDPVTLHNDFPNLDLIGRDTFRAGLSDTFAIGLLMQGQDGGETVYRANAITIQGEQVFVKNTSFEYENEIYLPLVLRNSGSTRSLLFSDDFADGTLTGWTSNNGTWTNPGTYMRGEYALGNAWNIHSSTGNDVVYTGTLNLLSGNAVGLAFRSSSDGISSYDVIMDTVDDVFKISRRPPYQVLDTYSMTVQYDHPYTVTVVANGSTIEAYLDGVKRLTVTDSTYSSGQLGVVLFQAVATYDDLEAWEMP